MLILHIPPHSFVGLFERKIEQTRAVSDGASTVFEQSVGFYGHATSGL